VPAPGGLRAGGGKKTGSRSGGGGAQRPAQARAVQHLTRRGRRRRPPPRKCRGGVGEVCRKRGRLRQTLLRLDRHRLVCDPLRLDTGELLGVVRVGADGVEGEDRVQAKGERRPSLRRRHRLVEVEGDGRVVVREQRVLQPQRRHLHRYRPRLVLGKDVLAPRRLCSGTVLRRTVGVLRHVGGAEQRRVDRGLVRRAPVHLLRRRALPLARLLARKRLGLFARERPRDAVELGAVVRAALLGLLVERGEPRRVVLPAVLSHACARDGAAGVRRAGRACQPLPRRLLSATARGPRCWR